MDTLEHRVDGKHLGEMDEAGKKFVLAALKEVAAVLDIKQTH